MKRTTIIVSCLLIATNVILGAIISTYSWWNVLFSSLAIALTALFICLVFIIPVKGGFKSSLPFIYFFIGVIEFYLGFISEHRVADNPAVVIFLLLVVFEVSLLIISNAVTKK